MIEFRNGEYNNEPSLETQEAFRRLMSKLRYEVINPEKLMAIRELGGDIDRDYYRKVPFIPGAFEWSASLTVRPGTPGFRITEYGERSADFDELPRKSLRVDENETRVMARQGSIICHVAYDYEGELKCASVAKMFDDGIVELQANLAKGITASPFEVRSFDRKIAKGIRGEVVQEGKNTVLRNFSNEILEAELVFSSVIDKDRIIQAVHPDTLADPLEASPDLDSGWKRFSVTGCTGIRLHLGVQQNQSS